LKKPFAGFPANGFSFSCAVFLLQLGFAAVERHDE
jgi:hypothetical protein